MPLSYKFKGSKTFPACTNVCSDVQVQAVMSAIETFRGIRREQAEEFASILTPAVLCRSLHAIRCWYLEWRYSDIKILIKNAHILKSVMNLDIDISSHGLYRGLKMKRSRAGSLKTGDILTSPTTYNGGCTSWTTIKKRADLFSDPDEDNVGINFKLIGGAELKPFIAPPKYSVDWFNKLYDKTMPNPFMRKVESEFAIKSKSVEVEIIKVRH